MSKTIGYFNISSQKTPFIFIQFYLLNSVRLSRNYAYI